jgi:2-polyprenyl-3-methyl-5-hydroxy-6-metoxy-1,4-benzoquinol methylase
MLSERGLPPDFRFEPAFLHALAERGERFDFVISNHLLHHLSEAEVRGLLSDVARVTRRVAVMNDLRRAVIPWATFAALTWPLRWHSFLHIDGLRSIRRSFRVGELRALVAEVSAAQTIETKDNTSEVAVVDEGRIRGGWSVEPIFPYRNAVIFRTPGDNHGPNNR